MTCFPYQAHRSVPDGVAIMMFTSRLRLIIVPYCDRSRY